MGHSDDVMAQLATYGSKAAPGFMKPEGIVVYHVAAKQQFKITFEHDGVPKSTLVAA